MSRALGCQLYYLVLSYALWLASLGRLASELTALARFTSGFHHFQFRSTRPEAIRRLAAEIVLGAPHGSGKSSGWTTALVPYLRLALPWPSAIERHS